MSELEEYGRSADRYNEIYKAVWQNFSYMALVAGAILTFGKDALGATPAALLACAPLIVWYWATFEPLNHYGDLVERRLVQLEAELHFELYTMLQHDRSPVEPRRRVRNGLLLGAFCVVAVSFLLGCFAPSRRVALHFGAGLAAISVGWLFYRWARSDSEPHSQPKPRLHVRNGIRVFALLIHAAAAYLLGVTLTSHESRGPVDSLALSIGGDELIAHSQGARTQAFPSLCALFSRSPEGQSDSLPQAYTSPPSSPPPDHGGPPLAAGGSTPVSTRPPANPPGAKSP